VSTGGWAKHGTAVFIVKEIQAILQQLERAPQAPHALATLVQVEGSSYRRVGARLLINGEGQGLGSISGGCLESDVILRAKEVLEDGKAQVAVYDTTDENDLVWGTGTGCNGVAHILIEPLPANPVWAEAVRKNLAARKSTNLSVVWKCANAALLGTHETASVKKNLPDNAAVLVDEIVPPIRLLIFGAGNDAQPLARLAVELGWQVEVYDARPAYAHRTRFPGALVVQPAQPENATKVPLDPWTMAVVMTHRYRDDTEILRALLPRLELPYLGLLGPKTRLERILTELEKGGLSLSSPMRAYVAQRQRLPDMASSICWSVGLGVAASKAVALINCPHWQ